MSGGVKRTTKPKAATAGPPGAAQVPVLASLPKGWGVGGPPPTLPAGGVGTSISAVPENFARRRDPRLDELARMGLQRHWLDVAAAIGVDAFLVTWRILDAEQSLWMDPAGSGLRIRLRRYESFLRFQRNRHIEALHALGLSAEEIRARVAESIGENLSERHIDRLRKQG